jgi:hypothetical protein
MVEVCRALVLAENQIGSAEARGVGEYVDLDDLAALDPGAEDNARPPSRGPHGPGAPVDERRSRKPVASREGADHGDLGEVPRTSLPGTPVDKSIICGMRRIPPGESIIP